MSQDRLLSDTELLDAINTIHLTQYSDDPAIQLNQQNYRIKELHETQKRLYAESVIGEDEVFDPSLYAPEQLKELARTELRAEQRARIK